MKSLGTIFLVLSCITLLGQSMVEGYRVIIKSQSLCEEGGDCERFVNDDQAPIFEVDTLFIWKDKMLVRSTSQQHGFEDQSFTLYPTKREDTLIFGGTSEYLSYYWCFGPHSNKFDLIETDDWRRGPYLTRLDETAEISGFTCNVSRVRIGGTNSFIYHTKELDVDLRGFCLNEYQRDELEEIEGFEGQVLRYTSEPNRTGVTGWYHQKEVTEITKMQLDAALFEVPEGYSNCQNYQQCRESYIKNRTIAGAKILDKNPMLKEDFQAYLGHWLFEDEAHQEMKSIIFDGNMDDLNELKITTRTISKVDFGEGTIITEDAYFIGRQLFVDNWMQFYEIVADDGDKLQSVGGGMFMRKADRTLERVDGKVVEDIIYQNDMVWKVNDMDDSLKAWKYAKIFEEREGSLAKRLWSTSELQEVLRYTAMNKYVSREGRFLACEIIFRNGAELETDHEMRKRIAHAYVNGLMYEYASRMDYWAFIHTEKSEIGTCGEHLLLYKDEALEELKVALHQEFDFYNDYSLSPDGKQATYHRIRNKDLAHFFICQIIEYPYHFFDSKEDRNKEIEEIWVMINDV